MSEHLDPRLSIGRGYPLAHKQIGKTLKRVQVDQLRPVNTKHIANNGDITAGHDRRPISKTKHGITRPRLMSAQIVFARKQMGMAFTTS